jgi:hypothetical protein
LTQDLHSATSQKTIFFIVTAVKASNRTNRGWIHDRGKYVLSTASHPACYVKDTGDEAAGAWS